MIDDELAKFGVSYLSIMYEFRETKSEPPVRIELTTFRLQGGCSTTELGRRKALIMTGISCALSR